MDSPSVILMESYIFKPFWIFNVSKNILLGPDSKHSYGVLKEVMKTIDFGQKGIKFTFQMIPLQFHYYAFKIHQCTITSIKVLPTSKTMLTRELPNN